MKSTNVHRIPTRGPADISGLVKFLDDGKIRADEVVCIIGKTEGNGGRNDFTRDLAMLAFEELFSERLGISRAEVTDKIIFSLSGGCEGVVSPHICIFTVSDTSRTAATSGATGAVVSETARSNATNIAGANASETPGANAGETAGASASSNASSSASANASSSAPYDEKNKRLAIGIGFTREFRPEEIGRMAQIEETAKTIRSIVDTLQVDSNADVHFIQMKGAIPAYTFEQGREAEKAHNPMRSDMIHSRGASALAAAVALNEARIEDLTDDAICSDWTKFSSVSSCSAKPGLKRTEIMVMANSPHWDGDIAINHGILQDMIDSRSVHKVLAGLGIDVDIQCTPEQVERIVGVFGKSEADPSGKIRGRRHTMLTDDDISDTRYSRCILAAVLASIIGDTTIYISTRAEHHGPSGGGTLAILAKMP